MAATPSPNLNDQQLLAGDPTFQNRVRQCLLAACVSIKNENAATTLFHRERETYLVGIMNSPDSYKALFANAVVTVAAVLADATVSGGTPLTSGNVAAQAALVTDANLNTAIGSVFNSFFRTPAN